MRVPRFAEVWTVAAVAGIAAFGWVLVRSETTGPANDGRRPSGTRRAELDPPPADADGLERWLERNPSRASAWLDLGNKRFEEGREADALSAWRKAEAIYQGGAEGGFRSPANSWYNFACVRARLGKADEALDALQHAVESGWGNAEHAETDPDLESIRSDPRFTRAVEQMRTRGRPRIFRDG